MRRMRCAALTAISKPASSSPPRPPGTSDHSIAPRPTGQDSSRGSSAGQGARTRPDSEREAYCVSVVSWRSRWLADVKKKLPSLWDGLVLMEARTRAPSRGDLDRTTRPHGRPSRTLQHRRLQRSLTRPHRASRRPPEPLRWGVAGRKQQQRIARRGAANGMPSFVDDSPTPERWERIPFATRRRPRSSIALRAARLRGSRSPRSMRR
jgi:hypothetical protein